jgi:hypothetical protein
MASKFAGIEQAKVTEKLPYINPGRYLFEVEAIKVIASRNKGDMFVAEYLVLESDGEGANAVGSRTSHVMKLSADSTLGNIKGLVAALVGKPADQVTSAMADELVAADNPAKGFKVRAEAFSTTTKAGDPFTAIRYTNASKTEESPLPPPKTPKGKAAQAAA